MKPTLIFLALAGMAGLSVAAQTAQPHAAGIESKGYLWNKPNKTLTRALKQKADPEKGKIAYAPAADPILDATLLPLTTCLARYDGLGVGQRREGFAQRSRVVAQGGGPRGCAYTDGRAVGVWRS